MRFGELMWTAFKLALSLALVAAPCAFLLAAPAAWGDPLFIGVAALLLFFAALPWVKFERGGRSVALAGIVFALGIAFAAWQVATRQAGYPQSCRGRRALFCEIENLLYAIGGPLLAAMPYALMASALLLLCIRALVRSRHVG